MASNTRYKSFRILDSTVDAITMEQAVEAIIEHTGGLHTPGYAVKYYVELLERAAHDRAIRELLERATLRLPEGVSVQWASAYLHEGAPTLLRAVGLALAIILRPAVIRRPISEKFGGTVFTWKLLQACAHHGRSVYLIGSPKGRSIEEAARYIQKQLPVLSIAGTHPGALSGVGGAELRQRLSSEPLETELVADLRRTKPDVILVAMGFPLQEEVISKLIPQLSRGFLIGEGGTFDYDSFGGTLPKAPRWAQRSGLEWLWRLGLEPSRWKRQLSIPAFMWHVYRRSRQK